MRVIAVDLAANQCSQQLHSSTYPKRSTKKSFTQLIISIAVRLNVCSSTNCAHVGGRKHALLHRVASLIINMEMERKIWIRISLRHPVTIGNANSCPAENQSSKNAVLAISVTLAIALTYMRVPTYICVSTRMAGLACSKTKRLTVTEHSGFQRKTHICITTHARTGSHGSHALHDVGHDTKPKPSYTIELSMTYININNQTEIET